MEKIGTQRTTVEQQEIDKAGIPQVGLTPNSGNQVGNTPAVTEKTAVPTKKAVKPVDNAGDGVK